MFKLYKYLLKLNRQYKKIIMDILFNTLLYI